MTETEKWKRRERGLAVGVILWALLVSAAATLRPDELARLLVTNGAFEIAGGIFMSIGLLGGLGHSLILAANRYVTSHRDDTEDLTEWDDG